MLNEDYYQILLEGRTVEDGLSVLRPEYLILFKAKAYLDLDLRKKNGEKIDSGDIGKHKKDILRIIGELELRKTKELPISVKNDIDNFIVTLTDNPFDYNSLKRHELKNEEVIDKLKSIYDWLE